MGSTSSEQKAYRDLISDYANSEPLHGFHDISDVPELSYADQAIVLRANPDILNEVELDASHLALTLDHPADQTAFCTHATLGAYVASRITAAVRKWVLGDLQAESLRRIESAQDDYAEILYGGNQMTSRERRMRDAGLRQKDFF